MGYMGNVDRDNLVQGYGTHRQWGTGVWGIWAMGDMGNVDRDDGVLGISVQ